MAVRGVIAYGIPGSIAEMITGGLIGAGVSPSPDALTLAQVKAINRAWFRTDVIDDFVAYSTLFASWVADPTLLTSEAKTYLIAKARADCSWAIDTTLTLHDRDEWLDAILKHWLDFPERLPWSGYDPLGLMTGRTDVISIDPSDTGAKRRLRGSSNQLADLNGTPLPGQFLFNGSEQYTWTRFAYIEDTDEGNNGAANEFDRFFNRAGRETTLYLNGGTHYLTKRTAWRNLSATATQLTRLVARNYPGTNPIIEQGKEETSAGVFQVGTQFACYRKLFPWAHIRTLGYRTASGGRRIYNQGSVLALSSIATSSSAESWIHGSYIGQHRGCSVSHPTADSEFKDYGWSGSTSPLDADDSVSCVSVDVNDFRLSHSVLEPSKRNFPYIESDNQSGATITGTSEGLDLASTADRFFGRMLRFRGQAGHSMLRGDRCDELTLEDFEVENYAHTGILGYGAGGIGGNDWILRRGRVGPFGQLRDWPAAGIQMTGTQDCLLEDLVLFGAGMACPGWGLALATNPNQTDNEVLRNTVRRIIANECSIRLAYEAGENTDWDRIRDNTFSDIALLDRSPSNTTGLQGAASYNALISLNLDKPTINDFGNTFTNILSYRLDGSQVVLSIQHTGSSFNTYTQAQAAAISWWSGGTFTPPKYRQTQAGLFWLQAASPARDFLTPSDLLLLPLPVDRVLMNPLLAELGPKRIAGESVVNVARPAAARVKPARGSERVTVL